jgi:hypothetical protein
MDTGSTCSSSSLRRIWLRALFSVLLLLAVISGASAQGQAILRMVSPNGGENLITNQVTQIRWLSQGVTGTLTVEYSIDSGATWTMIDTATAHNGIDSLAWTVPNQLTTKAFMRVRNADSTRIGRSSRTFTIADHPITTVRVLYPNGGQTFAFDSTIKIRWTITNAVGDATVDFSADSGATWTTLSTMTAREGLDTLVWTVPHTATTKALVRVSVNDTSDASDFTFTIRDQPLKPTITVLYPNGGEFFQTGDTVAVRWMAQDLTGQLNIQFSVDSGKTWRAVGNRQARNGVDSLNWSVPADTTTKALIRITSGQGPTALRDTSDATFTINGTPTEPVATLRVLYPRGGERLTADTTIQIRWNAQNVTGMIAVGYSTDRGVTWQLLNTTTAHSGVDSMSWHLPLDTTSTALVAVATIDGSVRDSSASPFAIIPKLVGSGVQYQTGNQSSLHSITIFPNPAQETTELQWVQGATAEVIVTIRDKSGRLLRSIDGGHQNAGNHQMTIAVDTLPAGSYLYELWTGAERATGSFIIVR